MSNDELILRTEAGPQDRDALKSLLVSTGVFHIYEIDVALELFDDRLAKGPQSEYFFIFADLGGETVGYVCYGPITVTERRFDLYWIAVKQDCHGRGIGRKLLQETEKRVREQGGDYIYVETSSRAIYEPTRGFYLRNQYQEVARVPFYYADDDDRVIYLKCLKAKLP